MHVTLLFFINFNGTLLPAAWPNVLPFLHRLPDDTFLSALAAAAELFQDAIGHLHSGNVFMAFASSNAYNSHSDIHVFSQ